MGKRSQDPQGSTFPSVATLEDLEPRILFSADHPAALVAATVADAASAHVRTLQAAAASTQTSVQTPAVQTSHEIVFIDSRVPDSDALVADIAAQAAAGRSIEVIRIGADQDGIDAITQALAGRTDVSAIHVIAHGSTGSTQLGDTTLDEDSLLLRAGEIAGWGQALTADADLLLYGCDTGAGSAGQALVQGLAQLTGADVAASDDLTGFSGLGGNWTLEVQTGHIEAQLAIDPQMQAIWNNVLATFTVTSTGNTGAGTLRQAILDANASSGLDTIVFNIAGGGVQTITPTTALPTITDPVIINGYTQPGAAANTASTGSNAVINIALNGTGAGAGANGLTFGAGSAGSTVSGLAIGGFNGAGILTSVGGLTVTGNFIGTNAAGSAVSANTTGVSVAGTGTTAIGTSALADRNLIAGNTNNVVSSATGTLTIQGNLIGTSAAGTTAIAGATTTADVSISAGTANTVGGASAGQGNVIAGGTKGVVITTTGTVASILGNTISQTTSIGIDLGNDGSTANDTGDPDVGPNALQNFPVLTAAQTSASGYVGVQGTLNSTANTSYRIEFYASPSGTTSQEGRVYLGFAIVTTNGSGNATIAATLSGSTVAVGALISATATRINGSSTSYFETSEFSAYRTTTAMNTQVVTTTADSGAGSLRAAITAANSNSTPTLISFNFPAAVQTITLTTLLPTITKPVIIDGTTATASVAANGGRPAIVINVGGIAGDGLRLGAGSGGSTIRGLVILNYASNQSASAIRIVAGSDGNTIAGNYLGAVGADGLQAAVSSGDDAVWVQSNNNIIGGSTAADRNVIGLDGTANGFYAILLDAGNGNQILGNYAGLNASGTASFTGLQSGIWLNGSPANTLIQNNVVSGAGDAGIAVNTSGGGTQVLNNRVGINAAGTGLTSTTTPTGIIVYATGSGAQIIGNWIGSTTTAGISLQTDGIIVQGNRIGTDLAGTANWGGKQSGIRIDGNNNLIGGTLASQANIIAFSNQQGTTADGISVSTGTGNAILGNSIYGTNTNAGSLGIDLGASGVTPNDTGDADTGANNLQNFPVLTVVTTNGSGTLTVTGTLNSTASSFFRIEVFANTSNTVSGYGEGKTLLGFINVATDASGNASFSTPFSVAVAAGTYISATATKATDNTYSSFTDTSEFAKSAVVISTVQNTLVVDTASDTVDGDTTSLSTLLATKGSDGFISLREALLAINGTPATSLPTIVNFGISGTGVHTITLGSALPTITQAVIIDGTTDDSFAANGNKPAIVINVNGGTNRDGLRLGSGSGGSTIRGLVISNATGAAIYLDTGSNGNTIVGNYLGALDSNGSIVSVSAGNYVVYVASANNVIGGTTAADRNVISPGSANYGLLLFGATATGNLIQGNYIGTDAAGTTRVTVAANAISIQSGAANNTIGGSAAGQGNVVATGAAQAMFLSGQGSGNVIQGNRVGISATGTLLGGQTTAIFVSAPGGVQILDNWIGGGTGSGISLSSSSNVVRGNRIGTDVAGTANWGMQQNGIVVAGSNNTIGGTSAGQGNTIANANQAATTFDGVAVSSGTGNAILGNSIYSTVAGTSGLGLDLGTTGVTANDTGDGDTGANNLQNFPVLTQVTTDGSGNVTVSGTLNSTASSFYRIEVFANTTKTANGYGEGKTFLGFINVTTDASGNATFSSTLSATVAAGSYITATATASVAGFASFTDTSEFSATLMAISTTQTTLVVDTNADTVNGDTSSIYALLANKGSDGFISLREAITAINNTPAGSLPTLVNFNIAGNSVHTITLTGALPTITAPVVIDGTTDTGSVTANGGRPAIVLNGNGAAIDGLVLGAGSGGSTVRGLVITNLTGNGVYILSGSNGNTVAGNYFGSVGANGLSNALAVGSGIRVEGASNTIGGTTAANRNIVVGMSADAVRVTGASAANNVVQGNWVNVLPDGVTSVSSTGDGIVAASGATNTRIGGLNAGDGNWIVRTALSAAGATSATGTLIQGNRIGTDLAGTANWGTTSAGVYFSGTSTGSMVQGNIIAFSGTNGGIMIDTGATGVALLQNSIYSSAGLGIDLAPTGVTPNDTGDADPGPNNLQNFPVLTVASTNGAGSITISGSINSTANSFFRIELFANTSNDASGYGEGQTYLGFVNVSTNASGNGTFSVTLSATVAAGAFISATATKTTDNTYSSFTDTSEFAKSVVAISTVQNTLIVDTNADTVDGDTTSLSTLLASKGADGFISLREAILAINNTPVGSLPTKINFGIAGTGVHTITLGAELPHITAPVILDGTTDDSFAANGNRPAIVLLGNGSGGSWTGLNLDTGSAGSTIRGLVIQGFDTGIYIASANNTIAGNYVGQLGTDGSLSGSASNAYGIIVRSSGNTIGGVVAADRNVISGNGSSNITLDDAASTGNRIIGNYIGTNASGVASGGGGFYGIWLAGGAANNQIGGTAAGAGNLIAGNTGRGVFVDSTAGAGNAILSNTIYSNSGLGIDLGGAGVTPNDPGDVDGLQNFPVLTDVRTNGAGNVTVTGSINSTANTYIRIEVYANTSNDPSGHGEGQTLLGFINVLTDASGNASFSQTLNATLAAGAFISATATRATDSSYTSFGSTSEFAGNVVAISTVQNTLIVDTADDTVDGDVTSISTLLASKGADGRISLREAIEAINNTNNAGLPTKINFGIPGTGLHTISLSGSNLSITAPVIIDGTTDDSFAANGNQPAIQLDGGGAVESGLVLSAGSSGSTIRGLALTGFYYSGIYIEPGSSNNTIVGNYLGTIGAGGQIVSSTVLNAIWVDNSSNNQIGGSTAADRNVIIGVPQNAVLIDGAGSVGNVVQGNYIGVMPDGLTSVSSTGQGILVSNGASNTQIGGLGAGEGNWIARTDFSAIGIVAASNNRVQGNRIGTDATGTANWGVSQAAGMFLDTGASDNLIQGNVVAFSGANGGILLTTGAGAGNAILSNLIYGNAGLGIDLGFDGVTPNDPGDVDTGPNNLQNFPVLTSVAYAGNQFTITGTLNSEANKTYRIEFFGIPYGSDDSSGHGEGNVYLGFVEVTTDGSGNAVINAVLAANGLAYGAYVTATATEKTGASSYGSTSEFGANVQTVNSAPVVTVPSGASYTENASGVAIAPGGTAVDTELAAAGNYAGATLTLQRNGGANAQDIFGNSGLLGTLTEGGNLVYNGVTVGSVTTNSGGSLLLTFNANATQAAVNGVIAAITYRNSSDAPPASVQLDWSFNDGNTGAQGSGGALAGTASTTVTITSVNDAPSGADKTVTTLEDTAYTFSASDFGFSDVDGNSLLAVKITTIPGAGTLTLNGVAVTAGQSVSAANIAAGNLKFTPAANANGAGYASFTFQVQDNGGTANGGVDTDPTPRTMTVNVTSVNDAPSGANKTVTTLEDSTYTFSASDFGFSDVDGNALLAVKITTIPGAGSLTLNGVAVTAGQTVALADITAGKLKFTPAANGNGSGYASFTFQVQDDGGTANGGVDTDPTPRTMTINVTSVNDAPSGANKTVTTLEDTAYTFSASDFDFSDVDGNALLAVKITTIPGAGSLTLNGVAVTAGQAIALADITAGNLKFTPAANANGTGYASFTFQVQDDGGTANGGIDTDPTPRTITVNVTSVNDAPSGANKTVTTLEDTAYIFAASDFGFSDADGNALLAVKITTVPGAGSLTLNGVAVTAGQAVAVADITAGNLKFTPAANANGAGYASFTFQVQDDGGTANGGVDTDPTPRTMTVNVTSVNDAPSGANNTVTTNEDTAYVFTVADFGFTDVDGNALLAVKITTIPGAGSLTLNGVAVTAGQAITAADITAGKLQFTPAANANGTSYTSFTFQVQDDGGTANGGVDTDPTPRTMTVNVTSVNDAPSGANKTVTTLEDTAYTFSTSDFGFSDVDGNALLAVKITTIPGAGSLTLNGVAVTAGQTVTAADIAAGNLKFTPAANANGTGYASFTFQVQDDGGTANGGIDTDPTPRTMTINVTSVNDAPSGANKTVTTLEDTAYVFTAADFGFSDVDGNALLAVKITTIPGAGILTLNGVAVTAGQAIALADITAGNLKFTPAANANGTGYASFTFQVQDDGGTANGGIDTDPTPRTMTINVTSVNDAPSGTNKTVTTLEDTAYTFTAADFGFNDVDGNALLAVKVSTLPGAGSLTLNGVAVTAGQSISVADITAGNLKFTPAANANGTGYTSFTFQVQDDGGTANGGIDTDPTPRTMTINVTSVNDAPSGTNNTVTTLEDTAYTFSASDFGFSDVDGNALLAVKITTIPGAGSLTLNGVSVTAGQAITTADIAAGNLKFTPAANANGSGYASFTFQVQDDGGTANGDIDTDPTPRTMTVNVTSVNDAPTGTNKTVTTLEDTAYTFSAADFGFSDTDGNALLAVKITTLPGAGAVTLNGVAVAAGQAISVADITAGSLKFTPAANANGTGYTSFTFQVQDDGGTANGGVDTDPTPRTMTINVTAVNDAPSGTNNTVTTLEDTAYVFSAADFGFNDVDGNALLAVKITTIPGAGNLTLNGVAVTAGQAITVADITAGKLQFTPAVNANGTGYASFTFQVQDDGGTANGGVDTDPTPRTMTIDVTSVNDAPTGASRTVATQQNTAHVFSVADFGFSDVDGNALLAVKITTLPAAGSLTLNGVAVTAGQSISAANIAAGDLVFTPALNASGTGYASFTFQVQDDGGTANGGVDTDPTPRTMTINVTLVNSAPSGTSNTVTTDEDTAYVFSAADFGFSDFDGNDLLAVKITTVPGAGSLTLNGVTVTAGQFVSAADLAAGKLQFTPAANANGAGYASFTFQVQDDGGTANGGVDTDPTPRTMTLDVTSVNDAPSGTNKTVTTLEDTAYTFTVADFGFSDVDGNALLAVKIMSIPGVGSLSLNGVAVTAGQAITAADIAAGKLQFTPAANANGTGYSSFTFQVQDDGGTANGGVDTDPTPRTMTVNVTSVNDAPSGASKTITTNEDTAYTFTAADFGFSDADGNALLAVKITTAPGAGSLTLNGVAVSAGHMVSAADIAAGKLQFTPAANANGAGYASFTFQVQDDGGTANGGVDTDPTPRTITINVTSVNDAPSGTNKTVTTLEDTAYTFTAADFGFSDVDGNGLLAVRITTAPGAGSLTLNGVAVTSGQMVSVADIAAGNLKFTPAANANGAGYASFTFQVQDDGGTANGGIATDPTPRTMTVNVTAVNDAPSGTSKTITTNEDTAYVFTTADFGFSDVDGNALLAVKITTVPGAGSLTLNGVAVTAGQMVSAADIVAGNLKFTPTINANGAGYASFGFQLQDDGGTANGGVDTDPTPRTITINVTSVNDAPSGTSKTVTTNENAAYTFIADDFGFGDADGNALLAVKITTVPGAGSLSLNGVAVTAGQVISLADITAGNLKFTPAPNANGAVYASFTFQVQDDGGTANGGVDVDPTPRTMTINVTAVNNAPSGTDKTVSTNEDTAYTFSAADFGYTDVDVGDMLGAVRIDTLPAAGSLTLSGVAVTAGQVIAAADIGNLVFTPAPDANGTGYASFTFSVRDSSGAYDSSPKRLTINVVAVDDAPTGTNGTVVTSEGSSHTFSAADFGFSGAAAGDTLSAVRIDTLPAAGVLSLGGTAVVAGQVISAADIGQLTFTPAADGSGVHYASFAFSVRDQAGHYAATPSTITVDVMAVDDGPHITSPGSVSVAENNRPVTTIAVSDPDTPAASLVFSIAGGADAALFTIDPATGALSFINPPDYEHPQDSRGQNTYAVTVQVSDGKSTVRQDLTVAVLNVNDNPPVIHSNGGGATAVVGTTAGQQDVTVIAATDPDGSLDGLSYGIVGGADAGLFRIDPQTGQLVFVKPPAYQPGGSNTYQVTVAVSDGTFVQQQSLEIVVGPGSPQTPIAQTPLPTVHQQPAPETGTPSSVPIEISLPSDSTGSGSGPTGLQPWAPHGWPTADGSAPGDAGSWRGPGSLRLSSFELNARTAAVRLSELGPVRLTPLQAYLAALAAEDDPGRGSSGLHASPSVDLPEGEADIALNAALLTSLATAAGLLIWASRSGALITSLLMAAPAWRSYDLLPILHKRKKKGDELAARDSQDDDDPDDDSSSGPESTGPRGPDAPPDDAAAAKRPGQPQLAEEGAP
ncbi:cadherin-like domain-containing protein [Paucibacter sp. R3-3]|uniref:Cadherin-like domain-containing protein n=1 Tax=Roseateles agri TaxID=3098619 RepID=A0ABU5DNG0_9BURK|nr:cadherin-like domain-containing protein [Paucibacter sp. R3-3]MDY0746607.1 cadherin-like domain-containing protein [Paucibacter sp. R3-3]